MAEPRVVGRLVDKESLKEAEGLEPEGEETHEPTSAEAMLEMILMKEDETKQRLHRAENEAQRLVEEAKLDAAHKKREASAEEVGLEIREKELTRANAEAEKITREISAQAEEIRSKGMEHVEDAIRIVIEGVLPPLD
jgi:vacuolar-type H+-ATPase subunit H